MQRVDTNQADPPIPCVPFVLQGGPMDGTRERLPAGQSVFSRPLIVAPAIAPPLMATTRNAPLRVMLGLLVYEFHAMRKPHPNADVKDELAVYVFKSAYNLAIDIPLEQPAVNGHAPDAKPAPSVILPDGSAAG